MTDIAAATTLDPVLAPAVTRGGSLPRAFGPSLSRGDDRFLVALFCAGVLHAVLILGVSFVKPESDRKRNSTLDVVLVQKEADAEPEDADFLAQANQRGGGDAPTPERPATPLPAPFTGPRAEIVTSPLTVATLGEAHAPRAPPGPTEPEQPEPALIAQTRTEAAPAPARPIPPKPRPRPARVLRPEPEPAPVAETPPKPKIEAIELVTQSLAYASLNAEVEQRLQEYAARPRRKWVTARTRESKYAAYMDSWRAKVERIGNLNYPDQARRERLSGTLLLDVALNADGSVNEVILRRSSGHRTLDDAAMRIVKLAAPYAPLPASIRREVDILHIERTWQFLSSAELRSR